MPDDRKIFEVDFQNKKLKEVTTTNKVFGDHSDKLLFFSNLIAEKIVQTSLNPRDKEVVIAKQYKNDNQVTVSWSHKFGIPDFEYDADGVRGTLSFSGKNHYVSVPWRSVFIIAEKDNQANVMRWEMPKVENEQTSSVVVPDLRTRVRKTLLRTFKKLLK